MTLQDAIQNHRQICDELYELALEENRFLQEQKRAPEAGLVERKRVALDRLNAALEALKTAPKDGARSGERRTALAKTQARILQILQLDRENEQLLTRHSLNRGASSPPVMPADRGLAQKAYGRPGK